MATTSIPSNLRGFLDEHIKCAGDLSVVPSLVAQLRDDHHRLETHLLDLLHTLSSPSITNWESLSQAVRGSLSRLHLQFRRSQGNDEERAGGSSLFGEEMSRLQGRLDESTRPINISDLRVKQENLQTCVRAMNHIEEFLKDVTQNHPQWNRLLTVIDSRVEKTIGILRPQAIREYQAILSSCGWPPSLASLLEKEGKKESSNPLLSLQGPKWQQFSDSFLCLCALQHQQDCQKARRLESSARQRESVAAVSSEMSNSTLCLGDNLWAIDVLVSPLVPRLEHHFSKWSDQPKFLFALVYKISQKFLEPIDNVLQPLMDKARLVKCSAKESWVSAMVKVLSSYLKANVFPILSESYEADLHNVDIISSWLRVIDLIIESDKRMQALACAGVRVKDSISEFESSIVNLLDSVFQDHPEWLQIWAEIELRDVEDKLKSELEDEKAWKIERVTEDVFVDKDEFLSSTREDYKAPPVADSVIRTASTIIERGKALPSMAIRAEFIKSSACILMNWFYMVLLQRHEETKSTIIAMEEESMLKLACSINAARYCETVMQGWTEDVTFLEIENGRDVPNFSVGNERKAKGTLFEVEIEKMIKLETDCLLDMVSSLLHQFDFCSRLYVQEKLYVHPQFDELRPDEEHLDVSREFVEALNILDGWLRFLKCSLNFRDFADLWRSLAGGLDHFILNSVILGDVRYGHAGTKQFKVDMKALYLVFKPFCIRPEAFFPCINDSLKLLAIPSEDVELLMADPSKREKMQGFLKCHGIFHLTPKQARRILGRTKARSRSRHGAV